MADNSSKSKFFLEQMHWAPHKYRIVEERNVPCFMISDGKELLITVQRDEKGKQEDVGKSRSKVVILWTNYTAFVEALQMLFFKLNESGKTFQQIYVKVPS